MSDLKYWQSRVNQQVAKVIERANLVYKSEFRIPEVQYNLRGMTAGRAWPSKWMIQLNPILLVENGEKFIERTVIHEIAHLIDMGHLRRDEIINNRSFTITSRGVRRAKTEVHGPSFYQVMRNLGASEDVLTRCHSYDVTNVRRRRRRPDQFEYGCSCPGNKTVIVGPKVHKVIQMGNYRQYYCKRCKHRFLSTDLVSYTKPNGEEVKVKTTFLHNQVGDTRVQYPAAAEAPTPPAPRKKNSGVFTADDVPELGEQFKNESKQAQATEYVRRHHATVSRSTFIAVFKARLGMSDAGAQTYYYNAKKKLGLT